jgi:ATP-binding cassette, subfamily C (CFTR/MRP), member 1
LDPVSSTGRMCIDGVSLHTVDRSILRQRIIAVPQDLVFFPDGTSVRTNLDPFGAATDAECQAALEEVNLWSLVSDRGGLESGMTTDSLSQG